MSRQTLLFALLFLVALVAWQLGKVELVPESAVKIENYQERRQNRKLSAGFCRQRSGDHPF